MSAPKRTAITATVLLLCPPLVALSLAHLTSPNAEWLWFVGGAALLVIMIAALRWSEWSLEIKLLVGLTYLLSAAWWFPLLGLLAVCTTGNCV